MATIWRLCQRHYSGYLAYIQYMPVNKAQENEVKKKFGENVRKVRLSKDLSQEKLAFEIGMDLTSVNEIENGHRSPKLATIYKISKALKVTSQKLLPF